MPVAHGAAGVGTLSQVTSAASMTLQVRPDMSFTFVEGGPPPLLSPHAARTNRIAAKDQKEKRDMRRVAREGTLR